MGKNFEIGESGSRNMPQMMLATIRALEKIGGSATVQELVEKIVEMEGVTDDERSFKMPDGRTPKLEYYLGWSRTYLRRGGAIENSKRGVWALTDAARKIVSVDRTREIYERVEAEERERSRRKRVAGESDGDKSGSEQSEPEFSGADPDSDWQGELLGILQAMDPGAFERLTQRLLREAGFTKVEVTGKTGDGGLDGVGVLRVNLVSFKVYFQCKRWKGSVGAPEIRNFRGALQGRAEKGLFVTTGTFTGDASREAARDGAITIDLIDGQRLCELLKEYGLGVRTETVERIAIAEDFFSSI